MSLIHQLFWMGKKLGFHSDDRTVRTVLGGILSGSIERLWNNALQVASGCVIITIYYLDNQTRRIRWAK